MPFQHPDWWHNAEPDIHDAVSDFAEWMRDKVAKIKPHKLIVKNPYLFRARAPADAEQLAGKLIDAFLSSSEETRFGDILETTAIAVCREAKGGWKSSAAGIDLEYDEGQCRTIVQVKSSMNWGNSSQRSKLVDNFRAATRTLRQGGQILQVRSVEGICYGPSSIKEYESHDRLVGDKFWYEISGWHDTGKAVLDVVGHHAGNGLSEVLEDARLRVVEYLRNSDATTNGSVDWKRLYDLIMMPTRERPK